MHNIHPLAVIDPTARLGRHVTVGAFSLIGAGVVIGDGCQIAGDVVIKSGVELGVENVISEGVVLGNAPQQQDEPSTLDPARLGRVVIGARNTLRENVTVHRAWAHDGETTLADSVYLMGGVQVAHDCQLASHVCVAQNTTLGGHVSIAERAFISGLVAIYPHCRVGKLAIVGAAARVWQDVPPYVTIDGVSHCVVGLNRVGLKRSGYTAADFLQLKAAYRLIFRSGLRWSEVAEQLQAAFPIGPAAHFLEFLAASRKGFVYERRTPAAAVLPMPSVSDPGAQASSGDLTFARSRKKAAA